LIGPNGAGKTTIFNLITGIYKPDEGQVRLEGTDVVGQRSNQIAALGIGRTFQEMRLWRHMTVLEHVKMARYSKLSYGLFGAFLDTPKRRKEEETTTELAMEYMQLFGVDQYADQLVVNLPYGAQRRVEMARALAMDPKVLLLDEPTVGMTPEEMADMIDGGAQGLRTLQPGHFPDRTPPACGARVVPACTGAGVRGGAGGRHARRGSESSQGY
jgi:branched-chain amino acid transport system ATP-binding protein